MHQLETGSLKILKKQFKTTIRLFQEVMNKTTSTSLDFLSLFLSEGWRVTECDLLLGCVMVTCFSFREKNLLRHSNFSLLFSHPSHPPSNLKAFDFKEEDPDEEITQCDVQSEVS